MKKLLEEAETDIRGILGLLGNIAKYGDACIVRKAGDAQRELFIRQAARMQKASEMDFGMGGTEMHIRDNSVRVVTNGGETVFHDIDEAFSHVLEECGNLSIGRLRSAANEGADS